MEDYTIIVVAIKNLNEIHEIFLENLEKPSSQLSQLGQFNVQSSSVTCLDMQLKYTHKIVAKRGAPHRMEYSFFIPDFDKDGNLVIINISLDKGGSLFKGEERLCDFNNTYVHENLLQKITEGLLNSIAFLPTKVGR